MAVKFADLKPGDEARILGFNTASVTEYKQKGYQQRLLAMGLVPDTTFQVVRIAPLGDPMEIQFHRSLLCLRKEEGSILQLERVELP